MNIVIELEAEGLHSLANTARKVLSSRCYEVGDIKGVGTYIEFSYKLGVVSFKYSSIKKFLYHGFKSLSVKDKQGNVWNLGKPVNSFEFDIFSADGKTCIIVDRPNRELNKIFH